MASATWGQGPEWLRWWYGDMPLWAQSQRVYAADHRGQTHWLAEVLGCTTNEVLAAKQTVQCGEVFLYVQPTAKVDIALGAISNVQTAGYIREAHAHDSRVGTIEAGRIDRAVIYDGLCYGNVGDCVGLRTNVIEFGHGWRLEGRPGGIVAVRK